MFVGSRNTCPQVCGGFLSVLGVARISKNRLTFSSFFEVKCLSMGSSRQIKGL